MSTFRDKVIIITGSGSGIGAETAEKFAQLEGILVLVGRNEENLKKVQEKCLSYKRLSKPPLVVIADLTDVNTPKKIVDCTINAFGRIDILVNNAGILSYDRIEDRNINVFDTIMNTNLRSVYALTIEVVPHIIKTNGNIVNISSLSGLRAFNGILSYGISKAGLDQFTKCLALELAPKGVRVNSVNPGIIITDIFRRCGMDEEQYNNYISNCQKTYPLGRAGNVDEVANAILFLASDAARFTTGQLLSVDGGKNLMCPR